MHKRELGFRKIIGSGGRMEYTLNANEWNNTCNMNNYCIKDDHHKESNDNMNYYTNIEISNDCLQNNVDDNGMKINNNTNDNINNKKDIKKTMINDTNIQISNNDKNDNRYKYDNSSSNNDINNVDIKHNTNNNDVNILGIIKLPFYVNNSSNSNSSYNDNKANKLDMINMKTLDNDI